MLDVEYLLNPSGWESALVYIYRSGALRREFWRAQRQWAEKSGLVLSEADPSQILVPPGGTLFDVRLVCDWSAADRRPAPSVVEDAIELLGAGGGCGTVHMLRAGSPLTRHPGWPAALGRCTLVEEPLITRETFPAVLRYLDATSDLSEAASFSANPDFVSAFQEFAERDNRNLQEMMFAYDDLILTRVHPRTDEFLKLEHDADIESRQGPKSPLRRLRVLVAESNNIALSNFVEVLDNRYCERAWPLETLVRELFHMTRNVLESLPASEMSKSGWRVRQNGRSLGAILWAVLVLASEDRLRHASRRIGTYRRSPDFVIVMVDELGRDFLQRSAAGREEDCLIDLWPRIKQALVKAAERNADRLHEARTRLILSLVRCLRSLVIDGCPLWIRRLQLLLDEALAAAEANTKRCVDPDVGPLQLAAAMTAVELNSC